MLTAEPHAADQDDQDDPSETACRPLRLPLDFLAEARLAGVRYDTVLAALNWQLSRTIWHRQPVPAWWSLNAYQPEIPGQPWPIESVLFNRWDSERQHEVMRVCLHTARFQLTPDQMMTVLNGRGDVFEFCAGPDNATLKMNRYLEVEDLGYGLAFHREDGASAFVGQRLGGAAPHGDWAALHAEIQQLAIDQEIEIDLRSTDGEENPSSPWLKIEGDKISNLVAEVTVRGLAASSAQRNAFLSDQIHSIIHGYNFAYSGDPADGPGIVRFEVRVRFLSGDKLR